MAPLQFWGRFLAPNAITFQQTLRRLDRESRKTTGLPLHWQMPRGKGRHNPAFLDLFPDRILPELCGIMGLAPFMDPLFREKFLFGDESAALIPSQVGKKYSKGLDPQGKITVYSSSPFLILADLKQLNGKPLPSTWKELANPMYRGEIVTTGKRTPDSIPYFYFYMLYGSDVMNAFGANVKGGTSPSRMAMEAGTEASMGGLYILPWFFAKCCPHRENTRILWPEEGAFVYPLFLLSRPNLSPPAQLLAEYMLDEEFGRDSGRMCLPTLHAASEAWIPEHKSLCFWDWEQLRHLDFSAYEAAVGDFFHIPSLGEKTEWNRK